MLTKTIADASRYHLRWFRVVQLVDNHQEQDEFSAWPSWCALRSRRHRARRGLARGTNASVLGTETHAGHGAPSGCGNVGSTELVKSRAARERRGRTPAELQSWGSFANNTALEASLSATRGQPSHRRRPTATRVTGARDRFPLFPELTVGKAASAAGGDPASQVRSASTLT